MVRSKSITQINEQAIEIIISKKDKMMLFKIPKDKNYKGYLYYATKIIGSNKEGNWIKQRHKEAISKTEYLKRKSIINNTL